MLFILWDGGSSFWPCLEYTVSFYSDITDLAAIDPFFNMKFLPPSWGPGIFFNFVHLPYTCNGRWQCIEKINQKQEDVDCYVGIETVTYADEKTPPHLWQLAGQHRATFQRRGVH